MQDLQPPQQAPPSVKSEGIKKPRRSVPILCSNPLTHTTRAQMKNENLKELNIKESKKRILFKMFATIRSKVFFKIS